MTDKSQNLARRVREQTQDLLEQIEGRVLKEQALKNARDFYRKSLGSLKGRLKGDRSQLEDLLRQLPDSQEDVRKRLEQLVASYEIIEDSFDEAALRQGAEDAASRASREAQQTAGQEAAHQAQDVHRQAAEQAREAVAGGRETLEAEIGEDEIRVPVIEEEIVVEKRPVVKEEIRVRKKIVEEEEVVEEDVRREEVHVERGCR